ncbi:MAG: acyl carrier protein [Burkholderiaceae bacterium]
MNNEATHLTRSDDTFERLAAILVRDYKLDPLALTPASRLDALGIDSLGVAELLFNVEDEFGIALPPQPVDLPTLADVVGFIDALRAGGSAKQPAADAR